MDLVEYRNQVNSIPYGKRLPATLYVYREENSTFGESLDSLVKKLIGSYNIPQSCNVIKFRTDQLKISFLAYPDFLNAPHPELREAINIDLVTAKSRRIDYSENLNPPILHRKENFLPGDHPLRAKFETLTKAEEEAGLYEEVSTIGFKLNWERLLASKGLSLDGHMLCRSTSNEPVAEKTEAPLEIHRHKTALARYDLSKPVKSLLEYGLLKSATTFFDYGCGQGTDARGLRALGFEAEGWDPVHFPNVSKREADIVNLGFVLNVIEDPAERLEALVDAYRHTKKLLVVSALIQQTVDSSTAPRFRDGIVTKRNTFQKFFEQQELQQFIEDALECTSIPVGLGIFYVFREPTDQQDFISARTRRPVDWNQISNRLGLGQPRLRSARIRVDEYEKHKELLDTFWSTLLQLGRQPLQEEFPRFEELKRDFGSPKRAEKLFIEKGGKEALDRAREGRRNDLLVYLAMSNLRKPVPFRHLSMGLKSDMRSFFGDYNRALAESRELLFAAGDSGEIEIACEETNLGWQDEQALYIHRDLLEKLSPVLRVYAGCASVLYGDMSQSDIIKFHKSSGKVTLLTYDDFFGKNLPELQQRVKVNLRTGFVQVFDHSSSGQLLYFKERYLSPDHPGLGKLVGFSSKLQNLNIQATVGFGPTKSEFEALLERFGLNENLNKRRPKKA